MDANGLRDDRAEDCSDAVLSRAGVLRRRWDKKQFQAVKRSSRQRVVEPLFIPVPVVLVTEILRSLRHGEVGLDIVAALSMVAALVFGESLAAAVVAVMYSGDTFLKSCAEGRTRREPNRWKA
jgi:cation transport ATPase